MIHHKKITSILCFFVLCILFPKQSLAVFDDWFLDKTLRVDYVHSGSKKGEYYSIFALKSEPFWGGSKTNLIDNRDMGKYRFEVLDAETNKPIYAQGYCTLWGEWQWTDEAKNTTRSMIESVVMPFPKKKVFINFYSRNPKGVFEKKFSYTVDPDNYFINPEIIKYPAQDIHISGDPHSKVDVVLIPEGYDANEMEKFASDCKRLVTAFFTYEPYASNKDKFNFRAVLAPSPESGIDIPKDHVYKRTLLNSSFYTFDSERYLMTPDYPKVRDVAANVPYDQIYIIMNTTKYGGGAIYNFYNTVVNGNPRSENVFVHEFGHGFAGLADEYDDGSTSFNDMHSHVIEPWEANITTLVNFDLKWKNMLPKGTPIPTPVEGNNNKLGVYEGAGYVSKGVYRPAPTCIMRSSSTEQFCPVCVKAIQDMIDYYCK